MVRSLGEREDLVAARVGEHRARPAHERVDAADAPEQLGARAQHQVVGVAEHDLGADRAQIVGRRAR